MSGFWRFRPIERWPREATRDRIAAPFRSSYERTLDLLERELDMLDATRRVIQVDLPEEQIRRDGLPYANAKPRSPGVIVSFDVGDKPHSFPCDRFNHWTGNLRAIALALEALRKVDRYGVTSSGEQYRGFASIEGPAASIAVVDLNGAASFLSQNARGYQVSAEMILAEPHCYREALRSASARCHPDRNNGNRMLWDRLNEVRGILDLHHQPRPLIGRR